MPSCLRWQLSTSLSRSLYPGISFVDSLCVVVLVRRGIPFRLCGGGRIALQLNPDKIP